MMGIGFSELMVILIIIMIIFGAGKLPQIGSAFGQSIRNFKKSMKEVDEMEKNEEAQVASAPTAENSRGEGQPVTATAEQGAAASQSVTAPAQPHTQAAAAKKESAPAQASQNPQQGQKTQKAKGKGKEEKSFEEELIEQAIKELKDKRIGTIRTPHDGLVQQGDVFTKSVDRTPWQLKGRDRGVNRDLF